MVKLRAPATLFAIAAAIWGSTWLAIKFQLGVVAPSVSVAYRFGLAALILAAWCMATGRPLRFSARAQAHIAMQGVLLFGFNYVGVYYAEGYATSGLVAVLFSTNVIMNPVGARWVFGTALTVRMLVAAVFGVAGVALLFLPELRAAGNGGSAALGVFYGLGATAIACAGNLAAVRNQRAGIEVLPGAAWGMAYGAAIAAAIALVEGVAWTVDLRAGYLLSLGYLAIFGSIVAFGAYLTLLKEVGPGPASYVNVIVPIVALALSTLFEGYRWTWVAACGVALAILGNWLALRPSRSLRRSVGA